jgi:hypothetical protein
MHTMVTGQREQKVELEVVGLDADHVTGVALNLVFMVWRFRTLVEPYRAGLALMKKHVLAHPRGIGVLQVVEPEAVPPEADTRKAFADAMVIPGTAHYSVTHEGTGFKAASVRAIVWGVNAIVRPAFPHSVHSSVADAARWAAEQNRRLGRNDDWQGIDQVVQELRRIQKERFPGRPQGV